MATVLLDPAYRRMSVEEFLAADLGDAKADLVDGLIYMLSGGTEAHARIAANLIIALGQRLRGSGCRPYGSDMATRTGELTVRFPDVSIYCGNPAVPENERKQLLGDPHVVFEVLSPSTSGNDQRIKLAEYRELAGVQAIVFADPASERVRLVQRTSTGGWTDNWIEVEQDLALVSLGIAIPHSEIFAAD